MDIEELRRVRALKANVDILEEELRALYFPYSSPNAPKSGGQNPNRGGNPTEQAYHRIERKKAELEKTRAEYLERTVHIEEWLTTVEDLEVVAIIRAHYILNKTWKQTAKMVYGGYAHKETPRLRVERFLEKQTVRNVRL